MQGRRAWPVPFRPRSGPRQGLARKHPSFRCPFGSFRSQEKSLAWALDPPGVQGQAHHQPVVRQGAPLAQGVPGRGAACHEPDVAARR